MAEGQQKPRDPEMETVVTKPRTFQGRKIVNTVWQGRPVEAVDGIWLAGRKNSESEAIDIIQIRTSEPIDLEHGEKAAARAGKGLRWIEPLMLDSIARAPNDPYLDQQWGLTAIGAEAAWATCAGDATGALLAILDSGMPLQAGQLVHPDLRDATRFIRGRNWVDGDDDPADDNGHGTHVMGIAAAETDNGVGVAGLLWRGSVCIIKVSDSFGKSSQLTFRQGIRQAIAIAKERELRLVINYSAGLAGGPGNSHTKRAAIEEALAADAVVVAAAGNGRGEEIDYPAAYSADFPHVIAVGAVDRHATAAEFSSAGHQMTVAAPGVDILSTMPNYHVRANSEGFQTHYDLMSGTSMAAPFVSALAALIRAKFRDLNAEEVRDRIVETATKLPKQDSNWVGKGIINAAAAVV